MRRTPLVGNIPTDFPAKRVDVELQSYTLFGETRQVGCGGLQVETADQRQPADGETIDFPMSGAAQLRETLPEPRRHNHDFGCRESSGFGFAGGQNAISQQNQGWA